MLFATTWAYDTLITCCPALYCKSSFANFCEWLAGCSHIRWIRGVLVLVSFHGFSWPSLLERRESSRCPQSHPMPTVSGGICQVAYSIFGNCPYRLGDARHPSVRAAVCFHQAADDLRLELAATEPPLLIEAWQLDGSLSDSHSCPLELAHRVRRLPHKSQHCGPVQPM